jgi:hypothetical protein
MLKKYQLINYEGCIMAEITSTSFKKAREFFKMSFAGKYKLRETTDWTFKNVVSK